MENGIQLLPVPEIATSTSNFFDKHFLIFFALFLILITFSCLIVVFLQKRGKEASPGSDFEILED